ncbi:MAG: zf-HC2 domain-containing protein [Planctomycetes bacterium]|nr:zf-HC2 domain-containing protein [Planctomycetota bacterium]
MRWRDAKLILALKCDESSRLTSASFDRPLTMVERMALAGHRLVCGQCRKLLLQLQFLREAVRRRENDLAAGSSPTETGVLSIAARDQIRRAIRQATRRDED